tara:strand:+ start:77 stop:895 length:819 start_codon:yes stop_codon:yes gene_type:complete
MSKIIVIMISLSILVSCSSGDSQQETIAEPTGVHSISELKIDSTVTAPTLPPTVITPTLPHTVIAPTKVLEGYDSNKSEDLAPVLVQDENQISNAAIRVDLSSGSIARYRIQEQLARLSLPNDAVGETDAVQGSLLFDGEGNVVSGSVWSLDVASLASDEPRRDRYVRRNTLKSSLFPEINFEAKSVSNLEWPLPTEGDTRFQILGDLTVMDVTREISWDVDATIEESYVKGEANTVIQFEAFDIDKPRLAFILSVDDDIRLELEFIATIDK